MKSMGDVLGSSSYANQLSDPRKEHLHDARREAVFNCEMARLDAEIAATRMTLKLQTHDQPHPAST